MTNHYKFGEIWLADLNPRIGTESGKTRPVVILQSQFLLDAKHPSTIILPLTTKLINNADPLRIRINAQKNLDRISDIMIDQIRTIDNKRLVKGPLFKCDSDILIKIKLALIDVIGLNDVFE